MTSPVVAAPDPRLAARVLRVRPLLYAEGPDPSLDRPAHVRAGSGIAWVDGRLAVVQDDAAFVALVDPADASARAVTLPAGPGGARQFDDGRGNKADKLDLEAVIAVASPDGAPSGPPLVVAFGSGSAPARERLVTLRGLPALDARVAVHHVPAFYAALRAAGEFAGSELNVEGAVFLRDAAGGRVRLFNRGNGAPRDGRLPVDATCDVDWPALSAHLADPAGAPAPAPRDVVRYALGALDGLALTFTDATLAPSPGPGRRRLLYTAAAEASPDATRDGPVAGCALGVVDEGPDGTRARWALLRDADGRPFDAKVEGLALHPDDPTRAWAVVDRDAPDVPSELCDVALAGPWLGDG